MVMAVFWLSGSAAWASGVSSVKIVSDPNLWVKTLKICEENGGCVAEFAGNFAGLNISIVCLHMKPTVIFPTDDFVFI